MPARRGRYITVFHRHSPAGFVQQEFLLTPDEGHSYVEAVNSSLERVDQPAQPALQGYSPAPFLRPHPVGELCDYNCAGVAAVLFLFEPGDHPRIALPLGRLTDYIRVEQPVHRLRRLAGSRRRGGTSSGLTGQAFSTESQLSFPASRRNTSESSSTSK